MKLTKAEEFTIRIKRLELRHSEVAKKVGISPPKLSSMIDVGGHKGPLSKLQGDWLDSIWEQYLKF